MPCNTLPTLRLNKSRKMKNCRCCSKWLLLSCFLRRFTTFRSCSNSLCLSHWRPARMPGCTSWSRSSTVEISQGSTQLSSIMYLWLYAGWAQEQQDKVGTENQIDGLLGTGFQPAQEQQSHQLRDPSEILLNSRIARGVHGDEGDGFGIGEGLDQPNPQRGHCRLGCPEGAGVAEDRNDAQEVLRVGERSARSRGLDPKGEGESVKMMICGNWLNIVSMIELINWLKYGSRVSLFPGRKRTRFLVSSVRVSKRIVLHIDLSIKEMFRMMDSMSSRRLNYRFLSLLLFLNTFEALLFLNLHSLQLRLSPS